METITVDPAIPDRDYGKGMPKASIDALADVDISSEYRFSSKAKLRSLMTCFRVPQEFHLSVADGGHKFSGEEALLLWLYRSTTNTSFFLMEKDFHRQYSVLSKIYTYFSRWMERSWGYLHTDNFQYWNAFLPGFAEAIEARMTANNGGINPFAADGGRCGIFGFVDCMIQETNVPAAGPLGPGPNAPRADPGGHIQRLFYNGWLHLHGYKVLSVHLPNGMTYYVSPLYSATRNDLWLLRESQFNNRTLQSQQQEPQLAINAGRVPNDIVYHVYGDSIFPWRECVRSKYNVLPLTPLEALFNRLRNQVRECVEWSYRNIGAFFGIVRTPKKMRLKQSDIQAISACAWLLTDALNCVDHHQTAQYFDLEPPTLAHWTQAGPRV